MPSQNTPQGSIDFKRKAHFVRLGHMVNEKYPVIATGMRIGGVKRGLQLSEFQYNLLFSLDPDEGMRTFSAEEVAALHLFVDAGILRFFYLDSDFSEFTIVPVPRKLFVLEEELRQGYVMRVEDGGRFILSEIAARLLPWLKGEVSLDTSLPMVQLDLMSNDADKASMEALHAQKGYSPEAQIIDATFEFMSQMLGTGAMTFEPVEP